MHCIPLIRVAETDNISFRFGLRNVEMYSKRHAVSCHNNNSLIPHLGRVRRAAWDWGVLSLAKAGTKENNAASDRIRTRIAHTMEWII